MTTPADDQELSGALEHFAAGRFAEAEAACVRILSRSPAHARALHLRGAAVARAGRFDEAATHLRAAVSADPRSADAWGDLAALLAAMARPDEAFEATLAFARLRPEARLLQGIADRLRNSGRDAEATEIYERLIALQPTDIKAHVNLGVVLQRTGRTSEAVAAYQRAISVDPRAALAHSNLAVSLLREGRVAEAEGAARNAVELDPANSNHWTNLATVLGSADQLDEALPAARRAIELDPGNAAAHSAAGLVLLMMGRLREAWPEFEWRLGAQPGTAGRSGRPVWDGSPLGGATLVLRAEQGYGDTIHFVRYATLARSLRGAGRVVVECAPALKDLIATTAGVDEALTTGDRAHDGPTVPVMSLPHRFETDVETIPATVPYLGVDPARVERLRPHVPPGGCLKIGLVWAGSPSNLNDRARSCPLAALDPLVHVPGVQLFSLQKGPAVERDAVGMSRMQLVDLGSLCSDFADLAAAMSLLDLVISVDTAPAHLAGALALPVWTLLPHVAEWRWFRDRGDSPWYPTMRLFRQPRPGDWDGVVREVVEAVTLAAREK